MDRLILFLIAGIAAITALLLSFSNGPTPMPSLDLSWQPQEPVVGSPVQFGTALSSESDVITRYHWSFGNDIMRDGPTASHTFSSAGTHLVCVTIEDERGRERTACDTVNVQSEGDDRPQAQVNRSMAAPQEQIFSTDFSDNDLSGWHYELLNTWASYSFDYGVAQRGGESIVYIKGGIDNGGGGSQVLTREAPGANQLAISTRLRLVRNRDHANSYGDTSYVRAGLTGRYQNTGQGYGAWIDYRFQSNAAYVHLARFDGTEPGPNYDYRTKTYRLTDSVKLPASFESSAWHDFELSFSGSEIVVRLDGQPVLQATDDKYTTGEAGLFFQGSDGGGWSEYQRMEIRTDDHRPRLEDPNTDSRDTWPDHADAMAPVLISKDGFTEKRSLDADCQQDTESLLFSGPDGGGVTPGDDIVCEGRFHAPDDQDWGQLYLTKGQVLRVRSTSPVRFLGHGLARTFRRSDAIRAPRPALGSYHFIRIQETGSYGIGILPSHTQQDATERWVIGLTVLEDLPDWYTDKKEADNAERRNGRKRSLGIDFSVNPNPTYVWDKVRFISSIEQQQKVTSIEWTLGDGRRSDNPIVIHTYDEPGSYEVCLKVKMSTGRSDHVCRKVSVLSTEVLTPEYDAQLADGEKLQTIQGIDAYYESGAIGERGLVYATSGAWIGASSAWAKQFEFFTVDQRVDVKIEIGLTFNGGTTSVGLGEFSETAIVWSLDDEQETEVVDTNFDIHGFARKAADIALVGASGSSIQLLRTLADYLGTAKSSVEALLAINQLLTINEAQEKAISFKATLQPGQHKIGVGVQTTTSGAVTGSSFASLLGKVRYIKITYAGAESSHSDRDDSSDDWSESPSETNPVVLNRDGRSDRLEPDQDCSIGAYGHGENMTAALLCSGSFDGSSDEDWMRLDLFAGHEVKMEPRGANIVLTNGQQSHQVTEERSIILQRSGTYDLAVIPETGDEHSSKTWQLLLVIKSPIEFTYRPKDPSTGEMVQFLAKLPYLELVDSLTWSFDGSNSTNKKGPQYEFREAGNHEVCLTLTFSQYSEGERAIQILSAEKCEKIKVAE